jgi:hypothetical protein
LAIDEIVAAAARVLPRWRLLAIAVRLLTGAALVLLAIAFLARAVVGSGSPAGLLATDFGTLILAASLGITASYALREWGAPTALRPIMPGVALVVVAASAFPYLTGHHPDGAAWWLRFGVAAGGVAALLVTSVWTAAVVRLTGSSPSWLALRERAALWAAQSAADADDEDAAVVEGLARVEAHRTPATAEFIDSLRAYYDLPEPADAAVEAAALHRFRLAEFRLCLSLGARPAWYSDFPWLDAATVARNGYLLPERMRVALA